MGGSEGKDKKEKSLQLSMSIDFVEHSCSKFKMHRARALLSERAGHSFKELSLPAKKFIRRAEEPQLNRFGFDQPARMFPYRNHVCV